MSEEHLAGIISPARSENRTRDEAEGSFRRFRNRSSQHSSGRNKSRPLLTALSALPPYSLRDAKGPRGSRMVRFRAEEKTRRERERERERDASRTCAATPMVSAALLIYLPLHLSRLTPRLNGVDGERKETPIARGWKYASPPPPS